MKNMKLIIIAAILFTISTVNAQKELTLFDRLGGTEGISVIADQMIDAHMQNPKIKHVFIPLAENPKNFERIKQNVKDFLAAGSGGSAVYKGKDLPTAHKGMKSTEADWVATTDDLMMVLRNNKIDVESQKDVLFILYSLKDQVIGK